ncbi:hypothetical protein CAPTEDRAFT_189098 [Capitella teleta]|uniref:RRM domain-containing protein n=1 Tax=Capitella teleta TaxID=283909 RepID=R7T3R7_CAPTE|nr:hypothetical protein CAPTEDRAFT_189098 [Capitella teleta]|eukprot:ELT87306.1 hypothetical protein CAPTEDRAFT_189098 [Capitella teleta]
MAAAASHLVVLFCATAGQNGENLGSDEEQIVLFVYLLYDLANNKFEHFLKSKEWHPRHGGKPFIFCVDGQLHFRLCLHPEVTRKNIHLEEHFNNFFDLRKEFKKFYKNEKPINCIKDMLDFLGTEEDQTVDYGVKQCQEMAGIIQKLVNDGHQFVENEKDIVKDRLEPGICRKDEAVDEECVIRARGLPWQSSDQDIARFFQGLNIANQQGRRNGEALIRFESKEHRDLALRKHKHHLGQRYIEVYRASGKDFLNIAGGNNTEAQAFLSRHSDSGNQVIVRMRGLPYTCTAEQVLEFFRQGEQSVEVLDGDEGILFVHQADGRATGDAFVLFANDDDATRALSKHRESIGTRYIELFKSTTAEVQQVLNRSMDPRTPSTETEAILPPLLPQIPTSPGLGGLLLPQQCSGEDMNLVLTSGLPQMGMAAPPASQPAMLPSVSIPNAAAFMPKPFGISPGSTMLSPHMNLAAASGAFPTPSSLYSPYTQIAAAQPSLAMSTQAMSALTPNGGLGAFAQPGLPARSTPLAAGTYPGTNGYQPVMYWYPSPPVSPQSAYYVSQTQCPTTVVIKGLPFNVQVADILAFFEGIYEMQPDVQVQRGSDGRLTGEAYITFGSRSEAERAITERNRKVIGNRFVEMFMA